MTEVDIERQERLPLPHNFIDVSASTVILGNPVHPFPALVDEVIPTTSTKTDSISPTYVRWAFQCSPRRGWGLQMPCAKELKFISPGIDKIHVPHTPWRKDIVLLGTWDPKSRCILHSSRSLNTSGLGLLVRFPMGSRAQCLCHFHLASQ